MFRRAIDLLASRVPLVRDLRISRELDAAYKNAVNAADSEERIRWATAALDIILTLHWQGRSYWEGVLHGIKGQGYLELRSRSNATYSVLARQELERAAELLTPANGRAWYEFMNSLSIAYAESVDLDSTVRISKALEASEAVCRILSWNTDLTARVHAQCNAAGYYLERSRDGHVADQRKAIELFEEVLRHTGQPGHEREHAIAQAALSNVYRERFEGAPEDNIEKAIELAESAMPHFEGMMPQTDLAGLMMNLANCYRDRPKEDPLQNREKAKRLLFKALELTTALEARIVRAQIELNLGGILASTGDLRAAIPLFESAAAVFTATDFPTDHAKIQINLSQARRGDAAGTRRDNADRAIAEARAAVQAIPKASEPILWAHAQLVLASALEERRGPHRQRNLEEAILHIEAALEYLSPDTHRDEWCLAKANLANALADRVAGSRRANLDASIALQREVLERTDPRISPTTWAHGHRNLALSFLERPAGSRADNVEMAIALAELGLVVLKPYAHTLQRSELLETLGDAFARRTRGPRDANLEDSYQAYDAAWRDRARDANTEAWVRLRQKRLDALSALRSTPGRDGSPDALETEDSPNPPSAQDFIDATEEASRAVTFDDHPYTWAKVRLDLAHAFMATLEPGTNGIEDVTVTQQPRIYKAIEIYESISQHLPREVDALFWAGIRLHIGNAYSLLHLFEDLHHRGIDGLKDRSDPALPNRSPVAMGYLDVAATAFADAEQVFRQSHLMRDHLDACLKLGNTHSWRRDWSAASEAFDAAAESAALLLRDVEVSDAEFRSMLRSLGDLSVEGPFAASMAGDDVRAVRLFEVGRARVLIKALALASTHAPPDLRREAHRILTDVRTHEARLAAGNLFDRLTPLAESMRLRQRHSELLSLVSLDDVVSHVDGYARLIEATKPNEISVLPLLASCGGRLLIARSSGQECTLVSEPCADEITLKEIVAGSKHGFTGWIDGYRSVDRPDVSLHDFLQWGRTIEATAELLGRHVLSRVFRYSAQAVDEVPRLNLFPQSSVGLLPIAAVPDGESGSQLIDRFAFSTSPSLSTLARARRVSSRSRRTLTVTAVRETAAGIPNTQFEIECVRSWFPPSGPQDPAGTTRADLIDCLRATDVWHFACHGHFDSVMPAQSGLRLAFGTLTLDDLLQAEPLGSPELVVLSACSTGLYSTEDLPNEFFGLASGLLQLGARTVIASLWPVRDTSTAILMACLYQKYFGEGLDACRALRAAQLWLRRSTAADIMRQLSLWRDAGRVTDASEAQLRRAVNQDIREIRPADGRPYASPAFWAPFVHFGA